MVRHFILSFDDKVDDINRESLEYLNDGLLLVFTSSIVS